MLKILFEGLDQIYPEMVEWRRHLHMNPELSFHEVETPKFIAKKLQEFGIEVRTGVGGRGVVGTLRGGKPGKTVALRADFDALPIQDEKDVPYKSQVPGVMHACGHDGHTSTLLGIAKVLSEHREELEGNVVFIHQFAEELAPGGAKPMIEDGCLDGVDAIFGTHLWSGLPVGKIGYRSGYTMAAADRFEIEIIGKGGHGAAPHETIDSIVIASQLVSKLQQIVSRRVDPLKPAVVTVGSFHAGNAFNVIADRATLTGTVRTFDPEVRDLIEAEIEKVVRGECDSFGAKYRYVYERGYDALYNHEQETRFFVDTMKQIHDENSLIHMEAIMGGEDFAYYLQKVPGTFFFTGAGNAEIGANYPHHHPKFDIDEKGMLVAAKALLAVSLRFLNGEAVLNTGEDKQLRIVSY